MHSEIKSTSFALIDYQENGYFEMRGKLLTIKYLLFYIGFSIVYSGCSKETESESFVNIADQYEIQLSQELSINGGIPSVIIASLEPQDCLNSYISHQTIFSEEKIQLFINEILTEGECESGNEIIREKISINPTKSKLPIEINLKSVINNSGVLCSSDLAFDLKLDKFYGLRVTKTHVNRILPKMIWGSYSLSDEVISQQIASYIKDLDSNEFTMRGDYGYFYKAVDNSITVYSNEIEGNTSFMITNTSDFEKFESKMWEFKQLDPSLIFQATNYNGSLLNIK